MTLDSNIYSSGNIDIDFRDRGIVEYFIESLLYRNLAYNVKIRISKEYKIRKRTIDRIKGLFLYSFILVSNKLYHKYCQNEVKKVNLTKVKGNTFL